MIRKIISEVLSMKESVGAATWLLEIPPGDSFHSAELGSVVTSQRRSPAPPGFSSSAPRQPGFPLSRPPGTVNQQSV